MDHQAQGKGMYIVAMNWIELIDLTNEADTTPEIDVGQALACRVKAESEMSNQLQQVDYPDSDGDVKISQPDATIYNYNDQIESDNESAEDSTSSSELDDSDSDYSYTPAKGYSKYKFNKKRRWKKIKRTNSNDADLINKTKKIDGRRNNKGRKMTKEIRNSDRQIHNEMLKFYQTCSDALVMVDGQKRFKCNICNENLSTKNSLFHHNFVHTGEKPYICNFKNCGATFKQPVGRALHEKNHLKPTGRKNKFMIMDKVQIDGNGEKEGPSDVSNKTEQFPESSKSIGKTLLPAAAGPSSSFIQKEIRNSVGRQILNPGLGRLPDDQFEDLKNYIRSTVLQSENRILAKLCSDTENLGQIQRNCDQ